jgi:hypothetical protein
MSGYMKIRSGALELFYADLRTSWQTYMAKLSDPLLHVRTQHKLHMERLRVLQKKLQ